MAVLARMQVAGVAIVILGSADVARRDAITVALAARSIVPAAVLDQAKPWSAKRLLAAAAAAGAATATSWLVCGDAGAIPAAESAGLAGVVLIGVDPPPGEHLLVVNRADSLADVPRVLIPRAGGCWHERVDS